MKNILIFAAIAGIAAAVAIYLVTENDKNSDFLTDNDNSEDDEYVSDADIEAYDKQENTGTAYPV